MNLKDNNLEKIKQVIASYLPDSEIFLFGSRARNDYHGGSDYDVMVVVPGHVDMQKKISDACRLTGMLAKIKISADIIIESRHEVNTKKNYIGNIVREACKEGIRL